MNLDAVKTGCFGTFSTLAELFDNAGYFLDFQRTVTQTQWAVRWPVAVAMVACSLVFLVRREARGMVQDYTVGDDSSRT